MARYSADSREQVRDAIDMVDLVSARTELRRAGASSQTGLCPFHDERTPSFSIDPSKKVYHCFGCGAGGDAFRFVQETEGVDFPGALELLADRYGVELEREEEDPAAAERRQRRERLLELLERTATYYARYLWESDEAAPARAVPAAGAGWGRRCCASSGSGYAPSAWDHVLLRSRRAGYSDQELCDCGAGPALVARRGVVRPLPRGASCSRCPTCAGGCWASARGRWATTSGRSTSTRPESELFHKGRTSVRSRHRARVARGEGGRGGGGRGLHGRASRCTRRGCATTVGLMGTALTEEQVAELARLAPRVLLALDADAPGRRRWCAPRGWRRAASWSCGWCRCRRARTPRTWWPPRARTRCARGSSRRRCRSCASVSSGCCGRARARRGRGRDRALAAAGARCCRELAPSALREELVRMAAGRSGLRSAGGVAGRGAGRGGAPAGSGAGGGAAAVAGAAGSARGDRARRSWPCASPCPRRGVGRWQRGPGAALHRRAGAPGGGAPARRTWSTRWRAWARRTPTCRRCWPSCRSAPRGCRRMRGR